MQSPSWPAAPWLDSAPASRGARGHLGTGRLKPLFLFFSFKVGRPDLFHNIILVTEALLHLRFSATTLWSWSQWPHFQEMEVFAPFSQCKQRQESQRPRFHAQRSEPSRTHDRARKKEPAMQKPKKEPFLSPEIMKSKSILLLLGNYSPYDLEATQFNRASIIIIIIIIKTFGLVLASFSNFHTENTSVYLRSPRTGRAGRAGFQPPPSRGLAARLPQHLEIPPDLRDHCGKEAGSDKPRQAQAEPASGPPSCAHHPGPGREKPLARPDPGSQLAPGTGRRHLLHQKRKRARWGKEERVGAAPARAGLGWRRSGRRAHVGGWVCSLPEARAAASGRAAGQWRAPGRGAGFPGTGSGPRAPPPPPPARAGASLARAPTLRSAPRLRPPPSPGAHLPEPMSGAPRPSRLLRRLLACPRRDRSPGGPRGSCKKTNGIHGDARRDAQPPGLSPGTGKKKPASRARVTDVSRVWTCRLHDIVSLESSKVPRSPRFMEMRKDF